MIDSHRMLFTAGQFAKLHQINKRTLHYYDDIGLYSPTYKGENGYRYYTYSQSPTLEMLLTLRELGMSIEEITQYMTNRSIPAFRSILQTKTAEIDDTIKRLKEIRKLLNQKERQLALCEQSDLSEISIVDCPNEYLLLSRSITGAYDDDDFAVWMEHMQNLRSHGLHHKNTGSMISAENIMVGNFEEYDYFFTRITKPSKRLNFFVKPGGRYIRAYCKGNWGELPDTYRSIIEFAKEHGVTLKGHSYEEGINEMTINSIEEYITQIIILCE
ncbi:MerR family transcriptional regulator [Paenibacillus terrigena]|uniref:MerR family transcriptional regulator n=1 Tax=Paenibacillus terrigena TaxID=369333 RepID=UPI0028D09701|nr:MerR family transcriptional regulator [Paenibacillus terrigena]